jgi:GH25 family lysozyme M1 (1,4-beta-N-acetylmuramidase)
VSIKGVDIASHQGPDYAYPNWAEFAVIKATGGHSYVNPELNAQVKNARARGLEAGFYHYMFEPSYGTAANPSGGDVQREAANFIQAVELVKRPGDTLWLDVEEYGKTVGYVGYLGDWCVQFCDLVGAHFGCTVGIYTATWFLLPNGMQGDSRLARYPLWFASWQDEPPGAAYLKPWTGMTMWQFNADGVDKDLFYGTREDWRARGIPAAAAPVAPPDPGNIRAYIADDGHAHLDLDFGGAALDILGYVVVDAGMRVTSPHGGTYHRSVKADGFEPWVREVQ